MTVGIQAKESKRDVRETLKEVEGRTDELNSMKEKFREFVLVSLNSNLKVMQGFLNSTADKLNVRDDTLETTMADLKEQVEEFKKELIVYKIALGNGMLASRLKQQKMDVLKPKEFKGKRTTMDVDNFI
ncbi:hypothetical protein PVK06_021997 [Gossypium arboreum]|uniref:Uncharacterized protein n=1 Tax=Gossypium arboreum TaxID=29729 RepID=A0ABR0PRI5_GOSAR|nr:hypothetical protein PVK06_021997 [Gossypium arboreum]